ncbi:MAG: bifunctional phosphoribosylaminoimidazolecarboxamide formyltransferase/IMP cyclohydrolase, partial [Chloroflexi bacterium]|nr:bifunctional phosphoribosylaminoimidazolecarboxamide formyltransferase/IMP cyclohydrolase [Chloroflexota bacterium]
VEQFTRSPEILDGRVKTLHPAVHGGILARGEQDAADLVRVSSAPIDLVVVNLYPFEQTIAREGVSEADAIEQIDIGGVALTRAAAKNFERVTVVCDPNDYDSVIAELRAHGSTTRDTRRRLAKEAFAITARYDEAIANYLDGGRGTEDGSSASVFRLSSSFMPLRYGENPHQQADWIPFTAGDPPLGGTLLQGKELSYNNLLDLDAAWRAVLSFEEPTIVIVKHLSPCGIASAQILVDAFTAALASDPISAFGGVIGANREVDEETVEAFGKLFIECIAAPAFSAEVRALLAKRRNCRLLHMPTADALPTHEWRSVMGGMLRQTVDRGDPDGAEWRVVSECSPSDDEMRALRFAWLACQHVKSNAIVLAQDTATVGVGSGQPNR